jgi:transposase
MEDVLSVYILPYDERFPQVCIDEISKQLVSEKRISLPIAPGKTECYDYEYERQGVRNIFIANEPLTGQRYTKVTERRTKRDWAEFIREIVDIHYPRAEKIVLVLDNLNIHTLVALYETFIPEEARRLVERLEIHYTPKHGSWLNMAEIELSVLSRQCLDHRIGTEDELKQEVASWQEERNNGEKKIIWRFTTQDARIKLMHLYPSISQ